MFWPCPINSSGAGQLEQIAETGSVSKGQEQKSFRSLETGQQVLERSDFRFRPDPVGE